MARPQTHSLSTPVVAAGAGLAAFALLALLNMRRARRAEKCSPPAGRFIAVDGVRLHYVDRGAGVPIVLLHGNGAMAVDFVVSGLIDRLSASFRVLAFDRPGFGYSARPRGRTWSPRQQARLIADAVQQLGIARPIVVGHSWGTLVALEWALARPQEVAALVLLSGYYFASLRKDVAMAVPQATPILGDILNHTLAPVLARLAAPRILRKIFAPRAVPARFATGFPLDLALRPAQLGAAAHETVLLLPAALALAARRRKVNLAIPVAMLAGSADEIVSTTEQSERLAMELDAPLTVIPGAGHMIHYDAPDRVAAVIESAATAPGMIEPAERPTAAGSFRAVDAALATRILPVRESERI